MKKIILTTLIIASFAIDAFSQREILYEDVDNYTVYQKQKFGVNGKYFFYNYASIDFLMPSVYEKQLPVRYGQNYHFSYGFKFKFKIFNWLSLGTDFNYSFKNIAFDDIFLFEVNGKQKDKLLINSLGTELFFRTIIGRAGNSMGKFIDFGGFGSVNFSNIYTIKITNNNPLGLQAKKEKLQYKNINIVEPFLYGALFRVGVGHFSLSAKYRFSDLLKNTALQETNNIDLPKFTIGVEIGLF
ncbi:MAG: hypothetical protein JXR68_11215 [Bacteroidales bacterium]|nr:hypothetical protein [Bacteroidales bacterium]